jgi:hypothetical protein
VWRCILALIGREPRAAGCWTNQRPGHAGQFSAGFDLFDLPDRLQVRRREGPQEAAGHQGRPQVRPGHWGRQEAPPLQARHRGLQGDQEVSSKFDV